MRSAVSSSRAAADATTTAVRAGANAAANRAHPALLRPPGPLVHAGAAHVLYDPIIHFEEGDFTIATAGNALVWSFRGEVTAERVKRSMAVHRDLAREYRKGFAVM